jgi:hypothetical protein
VTDARTIVAPAPTRHVVRDAEPARTVVASRSSSRVIVRAAGPPGPAGGGSAAYIHTQATPASTWNVAHGLGYRPSVELLDAGLSEIDGQVVHLSVNQLQVFFNTPIAGEARCQ